MDSYAAVILAGGAGRRLGGPGKPMMAVGQASMLSRVLEAVREAVPCVVVGPPSLAATVPPGVLHTREEPPGGGPVAATEAGLRLLARHATAAAVNQGEGSAGAGHVALLAADLPFLTLEAVQLLRLSISTMDGAVFVDPAGRRQLLCGLWRTGALRQALGTQQSNSGRAMRALVAGLRIVEVSWDAAGPPPWYDCDTEDDLHQAREWA